VIGCVNLRFPATNNQCGKDQQHDYQKALFDCMCPGLFNSCSGSRAGMVAVIAVRHYVPGASFQSDAYHAGAVPAQRLSVDRDHTQGRLYHKPGAVAGRFLAVRGSSFVFSMFIRVVVAWPWQAYWILLHLFGHNPAANGGLQGSYQ
jgi:hypothetical protein